MTICSPGGEHHQLSTAKDKTQLVLLAGKKRRLFDAECADKTGLRTVFAGERDGILSGRDISVHADKIGESGYVLAELLQDRRHIHSSDVGTAKFDPGDSRVKVLAPD